jgi:dihydroflavonol-4-reductase
MARERERTRFDSSKAERELEIRFRPLEETLGDVVNWYRGNETRPTPAAKALGTAAGTQ